MMSKVQPAADYWIIDVKDYWTIDRENLDTRLCHSTKREMAASRVYKFERRKYFEWIIKQLLSSAFVGYEEFADLRGCYPPRPSASVDNTLLDLQNSSYPTQPHSIIANYLGVTAHSELFFWFKSPLKVVLRSKKSFPFFFRFWKRLRLTPNWQNFELWVLSEGCLFWV